MPTYARADVTFERGDGPYLTATDGRRYLDFGAGVAVNALGHSHPKMVKALTEQAAKLWHVSNLYQAPWQERVARKLVDNSFADTVFFCNSGAEAMEACIKLARKYQSSKGTPERYRLLVAGGAFHGRTLATLAAGGQEKHLAGFLPVVEGFDRIPYANMNALRGAITAETAAVLVEPIQGEGGIIPGGLDYLREIRRACDEFGLLMILDEVQTGIGRTGKLFAHQWADIKPDIVGTAKGLGGGFPVGACLATEKAAAGMTPGTHGSTFGGNLLAMAAAETVLDEVLSPGFLDHVQSVGRYLRDTLAGLVGDFPQVFSEVRGSGLMLGLRCVPPNGEVNARLLHHGLITVAAGDNVIRFLPPLIITEAHVDEAAGLMRGALENWLPS
jgi:acetylornithine/N-succinyldiaminopimelate aminotransferase